MTPVKFDSPKRNRLTRCRSRTARDNRVRGAEEGGAEALDNQTNLDTLLLSGLRYVEAQRLQENKDWLDGSFIHLPEYAVRKAKRK